MRTPKQGQHAYWLDHYGLYGMVAGYTAANAILNATRIAAPTPTNGTQPIAEHCLIWPGPVNRDGYGYGTARRPWRTGRRMRLHASAQYPLTPWCSTSATDLFAGNLRTSTSATPL